MPTFPRAPRRGFCTPEPTGRASMSHNVVNTGEGEALSYATGFVPGGTAARGDTRAEGAQA